MSDLIRKLVAKVKCWSCRHYTTKTTVWPDEAKSIVYTRTECLDCGAIMPPPHGWRADEAATKMLYEMAKKRTASLKAWEKSDDT